LRSFAAFLSSASLLAMSTPPTGGALPRGLARGAQRALSAAAMHTGKGQQQLRDRVLDHAKDKIQPRGPNAYSNALMDLDWIRTHPIILFGWILTQLTPSLRSDGETNLGHWRNVLSVLWIAILTLLNPVFLCIYWLLDALESFWSDTDSHRFHTYEPTLPLTVHTQMRGQELRQYFRQQQPEQQQAAAGTGGTAHAATAADGRSSASVHASSLSPLPTVFFVNGIATTPHWLGLNCTRLANHYGTACIGVFNPCYGLLLDLIECVVQRNFNIRTTIVRQTAERIQERLDAGEEVLLIGHSQGGIIVSLVVDAITLHYARLKYSADGDGDDQTGPRTDGPRAAAAAGASGSLHPPRSSSSSSPLSRLAVLTFASAASHFVNPHGLLPTLAHYVNRRDTVGWSTLAAAAAGKLDGEVYRSVADSGRHLFNAAYSLDLQRDYAAATREEIDDIIAQ